MVNNSPVLIQGKTEAIPGSGETLHLSLQLADIDPQQYLSYLPGIGKRLNITGGRATVNLELTLPGSNTSLSDLTLRGTVNGSGLVLRGPSGTAQAVLPSLGLVIEALPLQHVFAIKDLNVEGAQLRLDDGAELSDLPAGLRALLHSRVFSIDRLTIDRATLTGKTTWQEIHLELTDFMSRGSRPAAVLLTAKGPAELAFQGQLLPSLELSGRIQLHRISTPLLQRLFVPGPGLRFSRGTAELDGRLQPANLEQMLQGRALTDTSLTIRDFTIADKKTVLLKGEEIAALDCRLPADDGPVECGSLAVTRSFFSAAGVRSLARSQVAKSREHSLAAAGTLRLDNCSARIPLGTAAKRFIELRDLNLQVKGRDLQLQAAVASRGKIQLTGTLAANGTTQLALVAANLELPLLTKDKRIKGGSLDLEGTLDLPGFSFNGSLSLADFTAVADGTTIKWKKMGTDSARLSLAPLAINAQTVVVEEPAVSLAPAAAGPATVLEDFFLAGQAALPIRADTASIVSGSMRMAGTNKQYLPQFTAIQGSMTPLRLKTPLIFNFRGTLDDADFQLSGKRDNGSTAFDLSVKDYHFSPAAARYLRPLKCRTDGVTASWNVSSTDPEKGSIRISGLRPTPDSPFSLVLALITDRSDSFTLPFPGPRSDNPVADAAQAVVAALQRLRLQSVISPNLVLSRYLPELNLPAAIEFLPGEALPDFMADLDEYKTLLQLRPNLGIAIQGHYDAHADGDRLLAVLQEEADAKTELANIKREQERQRLLAAEKLRLARLDAAGKPVDTSALAAIEQRRDLQPLPAPTVVLPEDALKNLAGQRARVIADYLTQSLAITKNRITIRRPAAGGSRVTLSPVAIRGDGANTK
jgi:hypothetical protein